MYLPRGAFLLSALLLLSLDPSHSRAALGASTTPALQSVPGSELAGPRGPQPGQDGTTRDPDSPLLDVAPLVGTLNDRTTPEETPIQFYAYGWDEDGDVLSFQVQSSDPAISASWDGPIEWNDIEVTLTPAQDFWGVVVITVIASDPQGHTGQAQFQLTVTNVDDPPSPFELLSPLQDEVTAAAPIVLSWEAGSSPDPPVNFYYSVYLNSDSTIVANGGTQIASWISETSLDVPWSLWDQGPWYWRVVTWDQHENSRSSTIQRFWFRPPPVQHTGGDRSTPEETPLTFYGWSSGQLKNSQVVHSAVCDNPAVELSIVTPVEWSDYEITLTPEADFYGTAQVTITAEDLNGGTSEETITLTVTNVNDSPRAFALLAPAPDETLNTPTLGLSWEEAIDPDPPVTITYSIMMADQPDIWHAAHHQGDTTQPAFDVTPAYSGTWYWGVSAWDGLGGSRTSEVRSFTLDSPPVVQPIEDLAMDEDTQTEIFLDVDDDGISELSLFATSSAPQVLVEIVQNKMTTLVMTPQANWVGTSEITVRAEDGLSSSTPVSFLLTVDNINDPPAAFALQAPVDGAIEFQAEVTLQWAAADDPDPDASISYDVYMALSPSNMGQPANLRGTTSGTEFALTPVGPGPWYWGITARDGLGGNRNSVINDFIVDLPPSLQTIADQQMDEDSSLELDVFNMDARFLSLDFAASSSAPEVELELQPLSSLHRTLVLTPAPDWVGEAQITVTVTDSHARSDEISFALSVNNLNDPPAPFSLLGPDDEGYIFTGSATLEWEAAEDPDPGASLVYELRLSDSAETLDDPASLQGSTADTQYVLPLDSPGPWYWRVDASDGLGGVRQSAVRSFIQDLPPQLGGELTPQMDEDGSLSLVYTDLEAWITTLTWDITCDESQVNMSVAALGEVQRQLTFVPEPDWFGSAGIEVLVTDGHGNSDLLQVSLTVLPVNDAPEVAALVLSTAEDTPLVLPFAGSDPEDDPLEYETQGVQHGMVVGALYTPAADYHGPESFDYRAHDGSAWSDWATVDCEISAVNDPPTLALPEQVEFDEDGSLVLDLGEYASDVDGDALSVDVSGQQQLTVSLEGLLLTLESPLNWHGQEVLTLSVDDGTLADQVSAPLTVVVHPLNDAPLLDLPASVIFAEDGALVIDFGDYMSDVDNDSLVISASTPI
ncbi:MAG: tandem-95 repeat protein, partial [Calditrichaeota bacterium]|nr:tandem-95 repeat protein [Calditrichota bacterium]